MKLGFCLLLFCLLPLPAFASQATATSQATGQATIVETETGYVVEYIGGEEDRQATKRQIEEREKRLAEERKKEEYRTQRMERRAAARASSAAEGD